MPAGDRSGPEGYGPMTGRGAGYCTGNNAPGFTTGFSRGRGAGSAGPFYRGNNGYGAGSYYQAPYQREFTPEMEIQMLRHESGHLENDLQSVKQRIAELENIQTEKS